MISNPSSRPRTCRARRAFPLAVGLVALGVAIHVLHRSPAAVTLAEIGGNVPSGLGVLEGTLLFPLPQVPAPQLLGTLLVYRVIYYLVPPIVAPGLVTSQTPHERRVWRARSSREGRSC